MYVILTIALLCVGLAAPQFPTVPPIAPVGGSICVPQGTCIGGGGTTGPGTVIDPRIVTQPGGTTPVGNCPVGQVACAQQTGGSTQCGNRHSTGTTVGDGPSMYGSFPWQAYIRRSGTYIGSGVLLDEWHVLTAAHKVYDDRLNPANIEVYMGVWIPSLSATDSQRRTGVSISIHGQYIHSPDPTLKNDIAIIRLNNCIGLGYQINVGKVCLPTVGQTFSGGCLVSGWGQTGFGSNDAPTNPQKQVNVNIVDMASCRQMLNAVLAPNVDKYLDQVGELCAGGTEGKDACTQDGGAPLVCPGGQGFVVAGLVIWGKGCGRANVPGVYVRVANYRSWIDTTVSQLNAIYGTACVPR